MSAARRFGALLADRKIGLVYGGASVGCMGALADSVLERSGEVIGVIPRALDEREVGHRGLSDLRVVGSMHERKALMGELADAFVALPGGIGTLEELFEVWTWTQLGIYKKPCALLNVAGFYDGLTGFLDRVVHERFLREEHRTFLLVESEPATLLERLLEHVVVDVPKWLDSEQI